MAKPIHSLVIKSKSSKSVQNIIKTRSSIFVPIKQLKIENLQLIKVNNFSFSSFNNSNTNNFDSNGNSYRNQERKFQKATNNTEQKSKIQDKLNTTEIKVEFEDLRFDKTESKKNLQNNENIKKIKETFERSKNAADKNKYSAANSNVKPSSDNNELVLIFSQQTGVKYYIYNSVFLSGYIIYFWINIFSDIPEPLFSTMLIFGSAAHIALIGLVMFSNRQVRNIYMKRNSKFLILETFSFLNIKSKSYLIDSEKIKEVRTTALMRKMNLFYFTYKEKFGFFKVFDYFVFRPNNTNQMFDNIFKSKLKK